MMAAFMMALAIGIQLVYGYEVEVCCAWKPEIIEDGVLEYAFHESITTQYKDMIYKALYDWRISLEGASERTGLDTIVLEESSFDENANIVFILHDERVVDAVETSNNDADATVEKLAPSAFQEYITGAIVHLGKMNSDYTSVDITKDKDLLIHEIGHVFGLEHANSKYSVMYPKVDMGMYHLYEIADCEADGILKLNYYNNTETIKC